MNKEEVVKSITEVMLFFDKNSHTQKCLTRAIELLQEPAGMKDEPTRLPFQHPVPNGYEVVTRDGRKVIKMEFFETLDMPIVFAVEDYSEVFTALPDGRTCLSRTSDLDLFLRPVERKVWVVEWPDGYMEYYPTMDHADHRIWSRNLPESTDRKHGGEPKKYEATLKTVV